MRPKIYFATSNEGKAREAELILQVPIHIARLEIDEVQNLDLEYIVQRKVESAYALLHDAVFVDDVGVYIEAWSGFPGPFVKYIRETGGNELLLKMLGKEKNRRAAIKCAIGYHDGTKIHTFIGEVNGRFTDREMGSKGWGFDPIFIPDGSDRTWAQMSQEKKNETSHRRNALRMMGSFLSR